MSCFSKVYINSIVFGVTCLTLVSCSGGSDSGDGSGGDDSEPQSFTVTTSTTDGGTISPSEQSIEEGDSASFTIEADTGFTLSSVSGCNGNLDGETYETGAITQNCTVSAVFNETTAMPTGLYVVGADESVQLGWESLEGATDYDVLYAQEAGISLDNIENLNGGTRIENVVPPFTISNLMNNVPYYFVVLANYDAGGESAPSNEISAMPTSTTEYAGIVHPNLNDTGVDYCIDEQGSEVSCPATELEGQDAELGRDAQQNEGVLDKQGSGVGGFDYTKLNAAGDDVSASSEEWSCVRDNHTELIWEVIPDDAPLVPTFTWYNPDSNSNGGYSGVQSEDNTTDYVSEVNASGLCGINDWRVPTRSELLSLVYHAGDNLSIDVAYFPNTQNDDYWTATPYAGFDENAWYVNFRRGTATAGSKTVFRYLRLVANQE